MGFWTIIPPTFGVQVGFGVGAPLASRGTVRIRGEPFKMMEPALLGLPKIRGTFLGGYSP